MTIPTSNTVMRATLAQIDNNLTEGQSLILSDRGEGLFTVVSNVAANGLDVLAIPGSALTLQLVIGEELNAYMFGFTPNTSAVENREIFTRMYQCCEGRSLTIHTPDENFEMEVSQPVIVGAGTTTRWGEGVLTPTLEQPIGPAADAVQLINGKNCFDCYGAVFTTGELATGYRFNGVDAMELGTVRWYNVKIHGTPPATATGSKVLSADSTNYLRGIIAWGGINIYDNCEISHMPNDGISTYAFKEAHYNNCRCNYNGHTGGSWARNGISNTAAEGPNHTLPAAEFLSERLTVTGGQFMHNYEEGIQFANIPVVNIRDADCRYNLDRAIEGDSAYSQPARQRDNDQISVHNCLLQGVPGVSNFSMSFNDGYNKDIRIGGNIMGGCKLTPLLASCQQEGSFTFTGRNTFILDDSNLTPQCHAIYVNAGQVDLSAGADIRGTLQRPTHDRTLHHGIAISINNDLLTGGQVSIGDIHSDITFAYAIAARVAGHFSVNNMTCNTGHNAIVATIAQDNTDISVSGYQGTINTSENKDMGFLKLKALDSYSVGTLTLRDNTPQASAGTYYPVINFPAAPDSIRNFLSFNNYWHGYSFTYGTRAIADAQTVTHRMEQDLPALS